MCKDEMIWCERMGKIVHDENRERFEIWDRNEDLFWGSKSQIFTSLFGN